MRGENNGVQSFISAENPRSIYVWCGAHRLALVVRDAVSFCINAINIFFNLEAAYPLVCSSKKRVEAYELYQKFRYPKNRIRRLKRVSSTRWMSQQRTMLALFDTYDALLDILEYISEGKDTEYKAQAEAKRLHSYFQSEVFLLTAFLFKNIFEKLQPLNLLFQKKNVDLLAAASVFDKRKGDIGNLSSDGTFKQLQLNCYNFKAKSAVSIVTSLPVTRERKRKKMPGELTKKMIQLKMQLTASEYRLFTFASIS
ncbi:uncharacterized protein LOC117171615 [Belonocnema kinseyi]|uniref:uncharacterized protein LOC117171615 n=1 Tax=Belonocnema kinseyi TaxID=2817044 RepID=UPI00143D69AE|nr:uncharacterized protein LOC117171615 [Belonocnema kinseyi]